MSLVAFESGKCFDPAPLSSAHFGLDNKNNGKLCLFMKSETELMATIRSFGGKTSYRVWAVFREV